MIVNTLAPTAHYHQNKLTISYYHTNPNFFLNVIIITHFLTTKGVEIISKSCSND